MLDSIFSVFEKLVTNFSWTRLSVLVLAFFVVIFFVVIFEIYTNYFKLNSMEREIQLLENLVKISKEVEINQENIQSSFDQVLARFDAKFAEKKTITIPAWAVKAWYSTLPWMFASVLILFTIRDKKGVFVGMMVIAVPIIILGASLPDLKYTWINHWVYPWVSLITVFLIISTIQGRKPPPSDEISTQNLNPQS